MNQDLLHILARYNVWATERLVRHLQVVSEADFQEDVGLYFKSIAGTLNHLFLGEHELWYTRFKQGSSAKMALDTIVFEEKSALLDALLSHSKNWISFVESLDDTRLKGNLTYQRASGESLTLAYAPTLLHVFNHGTHHRGQVTAAMTALGYECPELDLVYMLVEQDQTLK